MATRIYICYQCKSESRGRHGWRLFFYPDHREHFTCPECQERAIFKSNILVGLREEDLTGTDDAQVEIKPDQPHKSTEADNFCIIVARKEGGTPSFVQVFTGETWTEADGKVHAQIQKTFLDRVDVAIIDIYRVTDQGIEWHAYREDPAYMGIYRQIQILCRTHLVPDSYYLSRQEGGKFTLQVKTSFRYSTPFHLVTLDEAGLNEVQRYLQGCKIFLG